jgi:uroporphyrinogen-III synthase
VSNAGPLAGLGVVLTRPVAQCQSLVAALEVQGAHVIVFPALDIVPAPLSPESRAALDSFAETSLAIFASANAVDHGVMAVRSRGTWPESVAVAAVGEATAARLRASGFANVVSPTTGSDSEALLECPRLKEVARQRVVIFRGVGGREHLRTSLEARGARVAYVECYRRERPATDAAPLLAALARREIDAVHAMSGETVDNFLVLAGPGAVWSDICLVVSHPAIARHPAAASFGRAVVAGAGTAGLIEALRNLRKTA